MIDMVQPTLFFIVLVILVHQSVILASARFCKRGGSCAKGVDIVNPFWIDNGSLGEGEDCTNYPGFEVKCGIDGTPFISISNNHYTVLGIDDGYITVREAAINGQECPQPQLNFSTGSTRFLTLQSPEKNMTIFYNCSSPPPNIQAQEIPCLKKYYNNSTKHSYAFHGDQIPIGFDWYRNCEKSVLSYVQGDTFSNVEELQLGFYLDYKVPVNCSDCELSGGQCSSNGTTGAITCLCPGDINMIDDVCPSKVSAGFCRTNTSCANGVKIEEPFWIGDGSPGEGCTNYLGFRVKCASDGTPVINISNGLYTVLSLSIYGYDPSEVYYKPSGYIRVREADINGQECPQPQQNLSIGSTRFQSVDDRDKMRIFYNCSSPPPNIEAQEIRCLEKHYNNSTKHSYGLPDAHIPEGFDWYGNCEKNVLTYADSYTGLVEALRSGVRLSWKAPVNCTDCELSGGQCSSNETTGVITCHCPGEVKNVDEVCTKSKHLSVSAGFCYTDTSCGDRVKINEPFWIGDGSPGEGCTNHPEFRVECAKDGTPVMNISNGLYTVLSLPEAPTYSTDHYRLSGTVRVRESDINDQICPQPQQNLSISSIWFRRYYSRAIIANMRIFYNCSSPPPSIEVQEIRCLEKYYNNSAKHSYAFPDDQIPDGFDWYGNCEKNVLTYTDSFTDLVEALRLGFELRWTAPFNCRDCEDSGGKCSSNETTGGFTCDCPGYAHLIDKICPSDYSRDYVDLSIKRRIVIGVSAGVGSSILIFILLCIFRKRIYNSIVSYWRKKIKNLSNVEVFLENYGYLAIQRYKYSDIKKLTNSFKETLGQGGYGSVFKGKLHDGRLVAVKVLNEAKGKGEDFINEVAAIGKTNHVNVVSLLGFCTEKNKRALVYEYMPNGSLERFIYNEKNSNTTNRLGWEKLYEITLGIARGLEYLHRGCNTRILHLDIKPHNILLDQDFCPRISDFGLAKLCPTKESLVSMVGARGTIGYIAPEICCRNFGGVSHKSDVYSYGMMVLEMIGGRKNIDATVENMSEIYFPQWVYTRLEQYYIKEGIEDTGVQVLGEFFKDEKMKKMIQVALWCIQPHPGDRPSMSKVVEMLEGKSIELQMPPNPFPDPSSVTSTSM